MSRTPIVALMLAFLPATVQADSHEPVRNLVSLSVTAAEDVGSDQLVVGMFVEHEAREQAKASNAVNEDMAWALAALKKVAAVSAQTLDYRSNPVYDERQVVAWRIHQTLRLESTDHAALTALLGILQERLAIETVSYEVSDAVREAVDERLIAAAIARFSARALRIAASFGRKGYTIVNVSIDQRGSPPPPIPYAARMEMKADVASPTIEAGVQAIEVGISGTIELAAD